ncbi:PfkB family carbohydrate kinase [Roseibium sp.]|uniref:PfkB family carbohydrate kinase n=1 Tax=Roseibium sp. TaxID=1936156 RepID=UPI003A978F71
MTVSGQIDQDLLASPRAVTAFGAVHWDTIAHAGRVIRRETSTPAELSQKPGGVATNVARALVRLGITTGLNGVIGNDPAGRVVRDLLRDEGITTNLLAREGFSTGQYLALHDPDGSLAAACINDLVLTTADPAFFNEAVGKADRNALWFVDANLPGEVLTAIADQAPAGQLVADAVSIAKAQRLSAILPKISLLILNRAEAASIAGAGEDTPPAELASKLHANGVSAVVVTDGANPVHIRSDELNCALQPPSADIIDVTGAGDALIAGTLCALAHGHDLRSSVGAGLQAARLTLGSPGAVADTLCWDSISP